MGRLPDLQTTRGSQHTQANEIRITAIRLKIWTNWTRTLTAPSDIQRLDNVAAAEHVAKKRPTNAPRNDRDWRPAKEWVLNAHRHSTLFSPQCSGEARANKFPCPSKPTYSVFRVPSQPTPPRSFT